MFYWINKLKFWISSVIDGSFGIALWHLGNVGLMKSGEDRFYYILYVVAIIAIAIKIIYSVILKLNEKKYIDIEDECKVYKSYYSILKSNIRSVLDSYLEDSANKLEFHLQHHKIDRITLFVSINQKEIFLVSRYSENKALNKIDQQKKYNIDQGAIGKALQHTWHFQSAIPDPKKEPVKYKKYQADQYGINGPSVTKLSMKSRLYASQRVDISANISNGTDVFGIIILESEDNKRFTEEEVKLELENLTMKISPLLQMIDKVIEDSSNNLSIEVKTK